MRNQIEKGRTYIHRRTRQKVECIGWTEDGGLYQVEVIEGKWTEHDFWCEAKDLTTLNGKRCK